MTDSYLPETRRAGQVSSYSDSLPALPFSAARRLEKQTQRKADVIAARTYLEVLEAEEAVVVAGVKMDGAIGLERRALVGTAELGDEVAAALANASALSRQLCSEILVGTSGRVTRVLESGMRRIENA